jgi:hypothetical protein
MSHLGFGGKTGKHVQLRRTKHGSNGNTEMHLREIGWGIMDWINMIQDKDRTVK